MTEAEWLSSRDPARMLQFFWGRAGDRKLRLFACGHYRLHWATLTDANARNAVRVAERFADGQATREQLNAARVSEHPVEWQLTCGSGAAAAWDVLQETLLERLAEGATADLYTPLAVLLREVFGNPFRPVALDPRWLTPAVSALARDVYDERAFHCLPILADALEEAGCANGELLSHCRGPGPHVRGCWALDLVLDNR